MKTKRSVVLIKAIGLTGEFILAISRHNVIFRTV